MSVSKNMGGLIISPIYSAIDDSGRFLGESFVASGLATTIHDYRLTGNYRLEGAYWWAANADWGDSADFSVVDKDDVFGLFAYYGLSEGDVLELKKYADHIPLPPSDACPFIQDGYFVENPAYVCSGLYLRCVYDNNHAGDTQIGIIYKAYLE